MQICMLLVDTLDFESVESIIMCAVWTLTCVYMVLFLTPVCMHAYMVVKSEGLNFMCMWIGACSLPFIFVSLAVALEECAFFKCEGWHIDWSRLCGCKPCKTFTHPDTCMHVSVYVYVACNLGSSDASINRCNKQSTDGTSNQSIKQSSNQQMESINQTHPNNQAINRCINQSSNQQMEQAINRCINQQM